MSVVQNAIDFLKKTPLIGEEVPAFNEVLIFLGAIRDKLNDEGGTLKGDAATTEDKLTPES